MSGYLWITMLLFAAIAVHGAVAALTDDDPDFEPPPGDLRPMVQVVCMATSCLCAGLAAWAALLLFTGGE